MNKDYNLKISTDKTKMMAFNHLTPNGHYMGRTAQLTSRCCILNIYSTNVLLNILNMLHNLRFFLFKNAVYFIMLPFLVPILFTF